MMKVKASKKKKNYLLLTNKSRGNKFKLQIMASIIWNKLRNRNKKRLVVMESVNRLIMHFYRTYKANKRKLNNRYIVDIAV